MGAEAAQFRETVLKPDDDPGGRPLGEQRQF
jgi:hypothetical protein